jgi:hypothetical protein
MLGKSREMLLKIVAGAAIGLFVLDRAILSPAIASWKLQSERLSQLGEKVRRGRQLMERETSLRARWDEMMQSDLPDDMSTSESEVFKAIGRWTRDSRVTFTSLTPQWRSHDEGYDTFECRAAATGDQESLGRLLHEVETDPLPARIEECELSTRDNKGQQLGLSLRISFVALNSHGGIPK